MSDQDPKALPVQPAQAVRERSLLRDVHLWMASVANDLFISAGIFAGLSLHAATTKRGAAGVRAA